MAVALTIPDMYMEGLSLLGKEDRLNIAIKLLESVKDVVKPKAKSDDLDLHKQELMENWELLREFKSPRKIKPLE